MKVFSRQRCGLAPPRGHGAANPRPVAVSIHHGGAVGAPRATFKRAAETWRQFQQFHQDHRGWDDIGYHFGVDALGRLYEGRPVRVVPAAVGGHNTATVAICFLQDGDRHGLTVLQRRTLKRLFERGLPDRGVPPLGRLDVRGHNEFSGHTGNACPGAKIMRHLRWRRDRHDRKGN